LDDARVGKGHVTASAVTQQLKRFPACQIKGLQERLKLVLEEFSVADSCGRFVVGEDLILEIEDFKCEWKTFFVCDI
jgi:hypothetical protein